MPHAPSRRNLALLLLRSREGVMAHFRAILNQHGLTEQQWRVLRALLDDSPLEPRQICERCQLLSASATGVVDEQPCPISDDGHDVAFVSAAATLQLSASISWNASPARVEGSEPSSTARIRSARFAAFMPNSAIVCSR